MSYRFKLGLLSTVSVAALVAGVCRRGAPRRCATGR